MNNSTTKKIKVASVLLWIFCGFTALSIIRPILDGASYSTYLRIIIDTFIAGWIAYRLKRSNSKSTYRFSSIYLNLMIIRGVFPFLLMLFMDVSVFLSPQNLVNFLSAVLFSVVPFVLISNNDVKKHFSIEDGSGIDKSTRVSTLKGAFIILGGTVLVVIIMMLILG